MATNQDLELTGDIQETSKNIHEDNKSQIESKDSLETESTAVSKKLQNLRNRKKSTKGRLTKARNQLKDLLVARADGSFPSKNTIRRYINKIKSEFDIIEKIIGALKEIYAVNAEHEENTDIDTIIETLDNELGDIGNQVDLCIETANKHLKERLDMGEAESEALSVKSHNIDGQSSKSSNSPSCSSRAKAFRGATGERKAIKNAARAKTTRGRASKTSG